VSDYLRDRLVAAVGDHYLIEAELGRGGMGAVYRALDARLNRAVAIKVLPPDLAFNPSVRSRFLREAQMAARLAHPNIVPIYSVDEREGIVYFVMALVDGDSLGRLLTPARALPIEEARRIVADVADALHYAHAQGVVHRDIKPDNILLDRVSGRPMVTDFGIARAAAEQSRLTVTGVAVGTPAYMSPEQAMGERDVDGRSDIYSLGVVAYQIIAGDPPFRATNTPAMLMKHVSEPPPPLGSRRPDVPASLAAAIERALAKRPEDRWATAAEFRSAVLDVAPSASRGASVPSQSVGWRPANERPQSPPAASSQRGVSYVPAAPAVPDASGLPVVPALPWLHLPPAGLSRRERKQWIRDQRDQMRNMVRFGAARPEPTTDDKIAQFRRSFATYGGVTALLFGINVATHTPPWFIFPALGMMVPLMRQLGSLWGDGASIKRIFFGPVQRGTPLPSQPTRAQELAPPDILDGPHGNVVRQAAANRQVVEDLLAKTNARERELLPVDIQPTVTALVERIIALASTLHRLDQDASGATMNSLDGRLAALNAEPASTERDRRIGLLERQRSTLRDLRERRAALLSQLESASIALENLKLDMVRFRSAGVSTAFEDVTSATREARAVSREIGNVLDAADDVRRL
jgi:serine/threonine protein kinase